MILRLVDIIIIIEVSLFVIFNFIVFKFSLGVIVIIFLVVLVVFMEYIGDMIINGVVVGKNFIENFGLNRILFGDGFVIIVVGCLGGLVNIIYGENIVVFVIIKNYDFLIFRCIVIFVILFVCVGKFGGFF